MMSPPALSAMDYLETVCLSSKWKESDKVYDEEERSDHEVPPSAGQRTGLHSLRAILFEKRDDRAVVGAAPVR